MRRPAKRAVLKDHREALNPVEACPPDLLVRAAVLTPSEPVLSHIAGCLHCTNIYRGALGREWLPKHRGLDAHSDTSSRSANWFDRSVVLVQATRHMFTGLRSRGESPATLLKVHRGGDPVTPFVLGTARARRRSYPIPTIWSG
jgi:hypothetical protein